MYNENQIEKFIEESRDGFKKTLTDEMKKDMCEYLYKKYINYVNAIVSSYYLKGIVDRNDIDDIVEETFLRLMKYISKSVNTKNIEYIVFKSAKFAVYDQGRKRRKKCKDISFEEFKKVDYYDGREKTEEYSGYDESCSLNNKHTDLELSDFINKLDNNERKIVQLFCMGYNYKAISQNLGIE